jgi:hypothetical protein
MQDTGRPRGGIDHPPPQGREASISRSEAKLQFGPTDFDAQIHGRPDWEKNDREALCTDLTEFMA